MKSKIKNAIEKHKNGYNCAQSVICTYCDLFGMNEKTAFMLSEGFGAGMGGLQQTCGAVTGLFMLLGLKNSTANLENPNSKGKTNALVRESAQKFKDKNKSIICSELKGIGTGIPLRSCDGCIEDACLIMEELICARKKEQEKTAVE